MAGRIRIEPYKPLDVRTPPVPGGGYINVGASVGKFGLSPLAKLGFEIAEGLPSLVQAVSAQVARDDEAAVKDADARLGETEQALLFDPQDGYLNSQGPEAVAQAATALDAYSKAQEREAETLENGAQRRMLEALAQRRMAMFSEQVERHSEDQRQRWHDTTSDRRIATMQADAGFNWSDDALLRRALGTVRAEVRDKAERNGWASPLTEAALSQQTSRTLVSAIEAAVERDPDRARSLRTRYNQHIEAHHRIPLDALLTEAQTRQRVQRASAEILNTTPLDGETPTLQWQLQRAVAIAEPEIRAATVRTLHAAATAAEARDRALAEQVLMRVLKDELIDSSQIPVREWVALDAVRRQAIETRLDHNAAGTEPPPNPALVDELATQMTQATSAFARRDLVPAIAHLPLPQWKRFRDLRAGIRRNDPTTEDQLYAVKRGLQIARKMLPPDMPDDVAATHRAQLVEEIGIWRNIAGRSPGDADIAGMLDRYIVPLSYIPSTFDNHNPSNGGRPGIHFIQNNKGFKRQLPGTGSSSSSDFEDRLRRAVLPIDPVQDMGPGGVAGSFRFWKPPSLAGRPSAGGSSGPSPGTRPDGSASRALPELKFSQTSPAYDRALAREQGYVGGIKPPFETRGRTYYFNKKTNQYITRNREGLGFWEHVEATGRSLGIYDERMQNRHIPPIGSQPSTNARPQFPEVPPSAWARPKPPPQPGYGPGGHGSENWSPQAPQKPRVADGGQKKHIPGTNEFIPGRSAFTHPDPQALVNQFAATGTPANKEPPGKAGYRERVNFGQVIGTIGGKPTTYGIIHYDGDNEVHIVPANP